MEQMTITAKVQIVATDADKVLLDETMSVYRDACNYVSDYVFQTHDLKQFSLNKVLYSTLREKFGEYYGTAEPPVRCGESHLSGLTEPLHFVY